MPPKRAQAPILIITNPIAGRGYGGRVAEMLQMALEVRGICAHVETRRIERIDPRERLSRAVSAVIVIGGDGTLRCVVEAMLESQSPPPPLLVISMGTANLMARHLGLTWHGGDPPEQLAHAVIEALARRRLIHLDVARANKRLFLLMAGIGLDGSVVHELSRHRAGPIRRASYAWPMVKATMKYPFTPLTIHADGRQVFGPTPGIAFVANVAEYGTGFAVLPLARSDDRLLDLCVLPCARALDLPALVLHVLAGNHAMLEGAVYLKARHIRIDAPGPVPVQLDGDPGGFTPLDIRLLEERIAFIVP